MAETAVRERRLIFGAEMVRALLAGRKTQTRRVVKTFKLGGKNAGEVVKMWPLPSDPCRFGCRYVYGKPPKAEGFAESPIACPYGRPGERLWVRETYHINRLSEYAPELCVMYLADGVERTIRLTEGDIRRLSARRNPYAVTAGRFMPRWAARITLTITDVRVQRLQEISEEDAVAEGFDATKGPGTRTADFPCAVGLFRTLWNNLNAKRGCGWGTNPWVWALTLERVAA